MLSREDCNKATEGASVILHLAAGVEKSFPGCYMNSVVTTRNLLDSVLKDGNLKRFLNVSSIAVYSNKGILKGGALDENSEMDKKSELRYEAYAYGKIKFDQIVATGADYCVAACHNCHAQIHDIAHHFEGKYMTVHLWTLIGLSLGILGPNEREYLGDELKGLNMPEE